MRRAWDPALEPRVPAVKRRSREAWIVMQRRLTFIVVAVDRICMRARFCNRISSNERPESVKPGSIDLYEVYRDNVSDFRNAV